MCRCARGKDGPALVVALQFSRVATKQQRLSCCRRRCVFSISRSSLFSDPALWRHWPSSSLVSFVFFFLLFIFPYCSKGNGPSTWCLRARSRRMKGKTGKKKDPPKNFPLAASRQLVGWRLFFSFFLARIETPTPTEGIKSVSRRLPHPFADVGDTPTASRNCHWPTLFYLFLKKKEKYVRPSEADGLWASAAAHLRCRTARSQRAVGKRKWNPSVFTFCSMPFSASCRGCVENRSVPKGHPALARGGAITTARLCGLRDRGN